MKFLAERWGWGDHPRLRGKHGNVLKTLTEMGGSPPLTRETQYPTGHIDKADGITPAYAGNTPLNSAVASVTKDHPRLRGKHPIPEAVLDDAEGSPPLTRETLEAIGQKVDSAGITPAYAGNTLVSPTRISI